MIYVNAGQTRNECPLSTLNYADARGQLLPRPELYRRLSPQCKMTLGENNLAVFEKEVTAIVQ